jgi:hypothetical protein
MSKLTTSCSRPPSWLLATRLVTVQSQAMLRRMARSCGLRRVAHLEESDLAIPDSALARKAVALVAETSPGFLLNHGLRAYVFGAALGRRDRLKFDRELLFLAAVMHDLGLVEQFDTPDQPFELQGARVARTFLLEQGVDIEHADLVHEAIALHASIGVASRGAPEVQLCHYGTGVDVAGFRLYDLEWREVMRVVEAWPRLGFKQGFVPLLTDQVARKPHCNIAGLVGFGFTGMIEAAPFRD